MSNDWFLFIGLYLMANSLLLMHLADEIATLAKILSKGSKSKMERYASNMAACVMTFGVIAVVIQLAMVIKSKHFTKS